MKFLGPDDIASSLGCTRKCALGILQEAGAMRTGRDPDGWRISAEKLDQWMNADLSASLVNPRDVRRGQEYVYFIECNGGPVKIGYTASLERRITHIRMLSPYTNSVRCLMLGAKRLESALHGRFASLHIHGEWFRQEGALSDLLKRSPK